MKVKYIFLSVILGILQSVVLLATEETPFLEVRESNREYFIKTTRMFNNHETKWNVKNVSGELYPYSFEIEYILTESSKNEGKIESRISSSIFRLVLFPEPADFKKMKGVPDKDPNLATVIIPKLGTSAAFLKKYKEFYDSKVLDLRNQFKDNFDHICVIPKAGSDSENFEPAVQKKIEDVSPVPAPVNSIDKVKSDTGGEFEKPSNKIAFSESPYSGIKYLEMDLTEKFQINPKDAVSLSRAEAPGIRATDNPNQYFIMIDLLKGEGLPKKVFVSMDLDNGEPATMQIEYAKFMRTVIFPEPIDVRRKMYFNEPLPGILIPSISVMLSKAESDEEYMNMYKGVFQRKMNDLMAMESKQSFSEKYVIPQKS